MQSQRLSIAESWLEGWSEDWSLLDGIARARVTFTEWSEYDVRKFQNDLSLLLDEYLIKDTGQPRLSITVAQRIDALSEPGRVAKFPGYEEFLGNWIAKIDKGRPYAAHELYRKIASAQMAAFLLFCVATGEPREALNASHVINVWDAEATGEENAKAPQKAALAKGRMPGAQKQKVTAAWDQALIWNEVRNMRQNKDERSLAAIAKSLYTNWLPNHPEIHNYKVNGIQRILKGFDKEESAS